jgi:thiamine pyrophosphate-dependent acetolactate synthase large subunit-like protein
MEHDIEPYSLNQGFWHPVEPPALPLSGVKTIAEALVDAKEPLLITGYSGRDHRLPGLLVKLADTVKGLRVLDTGGSDMNFPADHRGWLGLRYGVDDSIKTADVILVLDCDVPWINTQCKPRADAKIYHVDIDPLKQQMPLFYLDALARYKAGSYNTVTQILDYIEANAELKEKLNVAAINERWEKLGESYNKRLETIKALAKPKEDGSYLPPYLISRVRHICPQDTIFAVEAVTNGPMVSEQLQVTLPGSLINCGGGGLGWSGGGSLGIKLATDHAGEKKFVCQIVGGTSNISSPSLLIDTYCW